MSLSPLASQSGQGSFVLWWSLQGLVLARGKAFWESYKPPTGRGAPALSMTSLKPSPPARELRLVPAKPLIPEDEESQRLARPPAIRCPRRNSSPAHSHWLASLDDPGSSRTGSPWPCLDFPKTNICLASPVQSRSVLSSGGGGRGEPLHSSRCPWTGRREWDGLWGRVAHPSSHVELPRCPANICLGL